MIIGRLEVGLVLGPKDRMLDWGYYESPCFCKFLDLGPVFFTWLSYECMAGMYNDKARRYRVDRYLEKRKNRKTT